MTFNNYQKQTHYTNLYPEDLMLFCLVLGIGSEAGEVADKIKKFYRGDRIDTGLSLLLAKELGDLLWYISELSEFLGYKLDTIAQMNIEKLKDRANRGLIRGSGDER